jgi:hypothetical protein
MFELKLKEVKSIFRAREALQKIEPALKDNSVAAWNEVDKILDSLCMELREQDKNLELEDL